MELVLLADFQNSFGSNWCRIANTEGVSDIKIGDRFREQGFGPGAEELEVAGVDISAVGGASRLFFNRGAGATQPEVHRLGAVFLQVGIKPAADSDVETVVSVLDTSNFTASPAFTAETVTNSPLSGTDAITVSKDEVAFPVGF